MVHFDISISTLKRSYPLACEQGDLGRFRERSQVATRSKLEQAIKDHAESLNDAQRELVMSQFSDLKRNKERIAKIEETLKMMDAQPVVGPDGTKVHLAQRMSLASERSQLIETNNSIASALFSQLKDKEN